MDGMGLGRKNDYEGGIAKYATNTGIQGACKPEPTTRDMGPKARHPGADAPAEALIWQGPFRRSNMP